MAEERPNMFARAMDAVQGFIRPDYSHNREVQRAATLAIATEQREVIDFARAEAVASLGKLADIPLAEREAELKLERIDATDLKEWSAEDWADKAKLGAKVEADVQAWAKDNDLKLTEHDDRLAAYVGVGSAYGAAHLSVNFREWEAEYWESHPKMTAIGEWKNAGPNSEYRTSVAVIDGAFHPAYEVSPMGGEGPYNYSELAFPTAEAAQAVADSFYRHAEYGDGEAGFRRDLAELGRLPQGQSVEAPFVDHAIITKQQDAVTAGREAASRGETVIYVHGRPFVDPGNEPEVTADAGLKRDPKAVIEEARTARITTAFSDLTDAVTAGERPEFHTEAKAEAFRRDLEAHYGEGVMERLRAGDTSDLARDVADRDQRQLVGAAVRMVAESHAVLRGHEPEQVVTQNVTIDRDSGPDFDL